MEQGRPLQTGHCGNLYNYHFKYIHVYCMSAIIQLVEYAIPTTAPSPKNTDVMALACVRVLAQVWGLACFMLPFRGSHSLSAQRARRMKSRDLKAGPSARSRGPGGP